MQDPTTLPPPRNAPAWPSFSEQSGSGRGPFFVCMKENVTQQ